jgi:hypothetical protein
MECRHAPSSMPPSLLHGGSPPPGVHQTSRAVENRETPPPTRSQRRYGKPHPADQTAHLSGLAAVLRVAAAYARCTSLLPPKRLCRFPCRVSSKLTIILLAIPLGNRDRHRSWPWSWCASVAVPTRCPWPISLALRRAILRDAVI